MIDGPACPAERAFWKWYRDPNAFTIKSRRAYLAAEYAKEPPMQEPIGRPPPLPREGVTGCVFEFGHGRTRRVKGDATRRANARIAALLWKTRPS